MEENISRSCNLKKKLFNYETNSYIHLRHIQAVYIARIKSSCLHKFRGGEDVSRNYNHYIFNNAKSP